MTATLRLDWRCVMKRRSREQWVRIIEEFERSEQGAEEFAASRGVNANTLKWWRGRLRREARAATPRFAVVAVEASSPARSSVVDVALPTGAQLRFEYVLDRDGLRDLAAAFGGR